MNLICLNNRDIKLKDFPQYTYHQRGKEEHKSIIDIICVSKGMFREEYKSKVIPITLTGSESHYPVLIDIKLHRNKFRPRKSIPKRV